MHAVHHYTSVRGALGILECGKLWFTERAHLNDPSEISHGTEIATAILRNQGRKDDADHLNSSAQKVFQDFRFFSGSFSFEYDDLHQWQNYGDDGRGVALSFMASAFGNSKAHIDKYIPGNPTAFACPMSYDADKLRSVIASVIEAWDGNDVGKLCDHAFVISSMFKNDCWRSENEYRFFVHSTRETILKSACYRSRERNGEIVSYLEIPIQNWNSEDKFPIYQICLGPAASADLDIQFADFLFSKGLPSRIVKSNLPYRSVRKF